MTHPNTRLSIGRQGNYQEDSVIDNILIIEQEKKTSARKVNVVTLELERFADSLEVEMSDGTGNNIRIKLDVEQAKLLAEFVGGFVGMVSA